MKVVVDISKLPCKNGKSCVNCHFYTADLCEVPTQLENFPRFEERSHGEWEWVTEDKYRCTNCNANVRVEECMNEPQYDYCPKCGADMRKEGNENG